MPILASLVRSPSVSRPTVVSDDNRTLDFRSIDGLTTVSWDGVNVRILAGALGLDMPPREVIRDRTPGLPGSRLRKVTDLERPVFLPMIVASTAEDWRGLLDRLAEIRRLANFRSDPSGFIDAEGTFDLVATTDGNQRRLRCSYLDGMAGDYGEDSAMPEWRRFGLELLAVDPYWHGEVWSTPTVGLPSVVPFLSDNPAYVFPRAITASVAIGTDMPVFVGGDVPSPAIVELFGPATETHVSSGSGLDVTVGALSAGETFILDTGRTKRALLDGVDAWDLVDTSPKFAPLNPGATTISVEMTGATADSAARVHGVALWESAW